MSIKLHTAYNLIGAALLLILSFITIPIYIGVIGEARYGVLAIAWLLLGYFGLFDLGLGSATAQRIAALGKSSPAQLNSTFWTALVMNLSMGVIGGLLIWQVAIYFFGDIFTLDSELRSELDASIPWLVLAVPLATISGALTGALQGRSKFLELNLISVSSSALSQLLPLAVACLYGPNLALLLPAVILIKMVTLVTLFLRCQVHVFQSYKPNISGAVAKSLLQFGGWVTVTSLISPMMVMLDRFVIGSMLGAKAVTYYTVPFQFAERSSVVPNALTSALFPRLARMDTSEARRMTIIAIRWVAVIMTPLMLMSLLLIEPFLQWWLHPEFGKKAGLTAQILLIGFWVNAFTRIPYTQLQAAGLPGIIARCHMVEVIPYFILLYIGLHFWSLPGAAVAFSMRIITDFFLLMWYSKNLTVGFRVVRMPALMILGGLIVSTSLPFGTLLWYLFAIGLEMLTLVWSWQNVPLEVRHHVKGMLKNRGLI